MEVSQLETISTDNGSNVVKSAKLMDILSKSCVVIPDDDISWNTETVDDTGKFLFISFLSSASKWVIGEGVLRKLAFQTLYRFTSPV